MTKQEYKHNYYIEHKDQNKAYMRNHYKNNKPYYLAKFKEHRERSKGLFLYRMKSNNEDFYIGSTQYLHRVQSQHLTGNSNLKLSKDDINNLSSVEVKSFKNDSMTRNELYMLEDYYIHKFNPSRNRQEIRAKDAECRSIEELLEINEEIEWKELDLSKYQIQ